MSGDAKVSIEAQKEDTGWFTMIILIVAFPTLFFLCVFFPIWMGWTEVY